MARIPSDLSRRIPRGSRRTRIGVLIGIVILIIILLSLRGIAGFYTDYLWFGQLGFSSVFSGILFTRILLALAFCAIFFVLLFSNLLIADRVSPVLLPTGQVDELVSRYRQVVGPRGRWVRLVTAVIFALFAGIGTQSEWNNWILFRYHVNFNAVDPEYHKNVAFYVFDLPFIKFLLGWFFGAIVVCLLVTAVAHYLNGGLRFSGPSPRTTGAVKTHLSVLLGILALIQAVGYYFQRLELVLSTDHVVDGATATSIHANKPADTLLIFIAIIAAGLFLFNIRQRGWTLPIVAVALWFLVWLLVGHVYPALYQALRVNPSELTRESPYIQRNITATRAAYGLTNVQVTENFDTTQTVTAAQVTGTSPQALANQSTVANVRLLDPAQLLNTFDRYQALRTFYSFNSLEFDRYNISTDGNSPSETAAITSARELNNQVPGGFVNQHLTYTHGYGAVVAPAGEAGVNSDGTPNFSLSDVPPTGTPALTEQGSQIYFGEGSEVNGYVVADSKSAELDYEDQAGNEVSTHYAGKGGVKVGGFLRRIAYALRFGDFNLVLSGQIDGNSRIMYIRNIVSRVQKAAPFLQYDADPYPVLLNGQVYWVMDAYTTTDNYPYSQTADTDGIAVGAGLSGTFNYVRNSVKVVINAYTGAMHFFVMDQDPIVETYEAAFPKLFTQVAFADELIPGITSHWRYPEDLFRIQTNMYGRYHLTNVAQFYSQANAWSISQDPGSGQPGKTTNIGITVGPNGQVVPAPVQRLSPQYELSHLPGDTELSFLNVEAFVPVSPSNKQQNLTAIMTASADPDDYGELNVYETPPDQTIDGPDLITATINANPTISAELSLLNQQGSQVELGEVVLVPIDSTLLYVQPIYVESSTNLVPQLKDVVVVYNGTAYHSLNASLDSALCQITNPDGSQPFANYCTTAEATRPQLSLPGTVGNTSNGSGSSSTSTTTAPSSSSTTSTVPVGGQTVSSLLAAATAEFNAASAALSSGNLAAYQMDISTAQADVAAAQALANGGSSPPSTTPPATTTTTKAGN